MEIEFCGVSGYSEVGRNMSALRVDNDAIIFDMGFHMQKLVSYEEQHGNSKMLSREQMIDIDAIPNDIHIKKWQANVRAITCSHAHFDHFGAMPYLAPQYKAPILGTPFTLNVLNSMLRDDNLQLPNPRIPLQVGNTYSVGKDLKIEFIHMTHSVPGTAMIAVHTKKGAIIYGNDFKLDNNPVLGKKPDYKRLKEIGKEGVLAVIPDSLYSRSKSKTPNESVARQLLHDVLFGMDHKNKSIIATCFASHVARLKSIIEFGKKLNRQVVLLGRSFGKYSDAAKKTNMTNVFNKAQVFIYAEKIRKKLRQIEKQGKGDYLIVCTGGQGEPQSVLSKMINKTLPFSFTPQDNVIFSNSVIPVSPNIENRHKVEQKLETKGVRIFRDVHVSGHSCREDLRELITTLNPEHIIPSHAHKPLVEPMVELGKQMGYSKNQVHLMHNGKKILL